MAKNHIIEKWWFPNRLKNLILNFNYVKFRTYSYIVSHNFLHRIMLSNAIFIVVKCFTNWHHSWHYVLLLYLLEHLAHCYGIPRCSTNSIRYLGKDIKIKMKWKNIRLEFEMNCHENLKREENFKVFLETYMSLASFLMGKS